MVEAEGRDQAPAAIDQPKLTQGSWLRGGGVVIERTFADALGLRAGDQVTLNGREFRVAGIAVTAAIPPYPDVCSVSCAFSYRHTQFSDADTGVIWLTQRDARGLATAAEPLTYLVNLRLTDPARAQLFVTARNNDDPAAPYLYSWQNVRAQDALLMADEQQVLLPGSWLLGLLAVASMTVLVGGRIAEQTRRVRLLKAVGASPRLITAVLLAAHLSLALVAARGGAGRPAAEILRSELA